MTKLRRLLLPVGASVVLATALVSTAAAGGSGQPKVTLCHAAGGKYVEITVAAPAVPAHMAHGDVMPDEYGSCP